MLKENLPKIDPEILILGGLIVGVIGSLIMIINNKTHGSEHCIETVITLVGLLLAGSLIFGRPYSK